MKLKVCFAAVAASLASLVEADNWMIDAACTAAQSAYLQQALANAKSMAATAATLIAQQPMSDSTQSIVDQFFDPVTNAGIAVNFAPVILGGVSRLTTQVYSNSDIGQNGVKFYCDISRFKVNKASKRYVDTDIRKLAPDTIPCKGLKEFTTLAQTFPVYPIDSPNFWQVQICPWFMAYGAAAPFKFSTALKKDTLKKLTVKLVTQLKTSGIPVVGKEYTPIDAVALFDKVLLHELTHANYIQQTIDVGDYDGYGWKNIKSLSSEVTENSPGDCATDGPNGPECNADTWALLGSILYQIDTGIISGVDTDGKYTETS